MFSRSKEVSSPRLKALKISFAGLPVYLKKVARTSGIGSGVFDFGKRCSTERDCSLQKTAALD